MNIPNNIPYRSCGTDVCCLVAYITGSGSCDQEGSFLPYVPIPILEEKHFFLPTNNILRVHLLVLGICKTCNPNQTKVG